jgi:hypothetical protein
MVLPTRRGQIGFVLRICSAPEVPSRPAAPGIGFVLRVLPVAGRIGFVLHNRPLAEAPGPPMRAHLRTPGPKLGSFGAFTPCRSPRPAPPDTASVPRFGQLGSFCTIGSPESWQAAIEELGSFCAFALVPWALSRVASAGIGFVAGTTPGHEALSHVSLSREPARLPDWADWACLAHLTPFVGWGWPHRLLPAGGIGFVPHAWPASSCLSSYCRFQIMSHKS